MSFVQALVHPEDLVALVKFKFLGGAESVTPRVNLSTLDKPLQVCYQLLKRTSRSFAVVIQALDEELRDAVCLFYLVLRALDTVEDDMTITSAEKIPLLKKFHEFLDDPTWSYSKSSCKDGVVLERFPVISNEYRRLKPAFRDVIKDITARMGAGFCIYLEKEVSTLADWDEYCHFAAGLVGVGLSQLFAASGLEDVSVATSTELSNSMGLFLQKTNIIRDYLEDVNDNRHFWPREVWSQYAPNIGDFRKREMSAPAVACLNHLITNALSHVPDVIAYLSQLKNQSIFNFCAIPQVMAIATLARCYNNHNVFTGVVKIRKGEACSMMMESTNMEKTVEIFNERILELGGKITVTDPSASITLSSVQNALVLCHSSLQQKGTEASVKPTLKIQLPAVRLDHEDRVGLYRLRSSRKESRRSLLLSPLLSWTVCLLAVTYQYWGLYLPVQLKDSL
ncbi:squalene synthase-like [Sycon ciliatum]|uniref:squalene synthase-like n=1 Tax=Sycon ciliatum TaxID=27933 RepID=UPI0020A85BD5|eukprot:scpid46756/ scgid30211/ Squalene synthase; FPP:FPP farnesyltransferase; Farnesyl-diphosphate farnesyltransferase &gt; Squalene synthase; FPP:FPP farnesyltransferase; Farnesyl-diphosphate farnesyltransferase